MPPFLLDANFFIEAYRKGFPMDVVPSFWDKLKELSIVSKVISLDKVKAEIFKHEDALKQWCENHLPENFFYDSSEVILVYGEVVRWAHSKRDNPYTQAALDVFMDADTADAWLVAYALQHGLPLVTNEVSAPDSKRSIKIPDVCRPFGVQVYQPMDMFRALGERI
ncbi:MAG: DUF4411 family protein [Saprospiraceae bacterium]